ncbi:helix-turn-helix domain-containing protein [Paenibacillus sp.]|uniref:helix-turn-helix domain-containing protein n=1 Tax=Paenibacillus sp. TaxID=58172 RepID=UPI00281197AF|nr:helix-turn-helix domain-containing protein [Paenibacillus sp.]
MSFLKTLTNSYFAKLVFFGCFLTTLPLLALGFYSYKTTLDMTEARTNRETMQLLIQLRLTTEQVLKTATHSVTQTASSPVTERSLESSFKGEDFRLYKDLTASLRNLQTFDTGIQDILFVNARQGWTVGNDGLRRWDPTRDDLAFDRYSDERTEDAYWAFQAHSAFPGQPIDSDPRCNRHLEYVVKLPVDRYEKSGLLLTRIPVCEMLRFFPQSEKQYFILDESMRVIVADRPEVLGRSLTDVTTYEPTDVADLQDFFKSEIDGRPYVLTYHRSSTNGWTYLSATPMSELTRESERIGWFTFYLCLAFLLAGAGMVCWFSLRMYRPVRALLRSVLPKSAADELPGRQNEFQWIGQQFQRLRQSKEKLEQERSAHMNHAKSYFLLRLLQGDIRPKEIDEQLRTFGYAAHAAQWRQMAVLSIQFDALEQSRYRESDRSLLLFAVGNIVEELIPEHRRLSPTIIDKTQIALVGDSNADEADFARGLEQYALQIQSTVSSLLGLSVSVAISQPFQAFREAPRAFQEGAEALHHRMRLGGGLVVRYSSLPPNQKFAIAYPKRWEDALTDSIRLTEPEQAHEALDRLLREIFAVERHPKEYQIALARLLNQLIIVMQELGVSIGSVFRDNESPYDRLFQLKTLAEIEAWLKTDIVAPMIDTLLERKQAQYRHLSEEMIAMIHNEFDTDLTLEKCAKRMHYNISYLSGAFRKEAGLSFSEYLSNYRLHMAKKWLLETEMSIKDIAERLQYNNSQNFIRAFRKAEQMTPGQYRKEACRPE